MLQMVLRVLMPQAPQLLQALLLILSPPTVQMVQLPQVLQATPLLLMPPTALRLLMLQATHSPLTLPMDLRAPMDLMLPMV